MNPSTLIEKDSWENDGGRISFNCPECGWLNELGNKVDENGDVLGEVECQECTFVGKISLVDWKK